MTKSSPPSIESKHAAAKTGRGRLRPSPASVAARNLALREALRNAVVSRALFDDKG